MSYQSFNKNCSDVISNLKQLIDVDPFDFSIDFSIDDYTDLHINQFSDSLTISTFLLQIPLSEYPMVSHYKSINVTVGYIDVTFDLSGIQLEYKYTVGLNSSLQHVYEEYAENLKVLLSLIEKINEMTGAHLSGRTGDLDGVDIEELKKKINEAFTNQVSESEESDDEDDEEKEGTD